MHKKGGAIMHTCVSLRCPYMNTCKEYNFLIDRNKHCDHAINLTAAAQLYMAREKLNIIKNYLENTQLIKKYLNYNAVSTEYKQPIPAISIDYDKITIYVTIDKNIFEDIMNTALKTFPEIGEFHFQKGPTQYCTSSYIECYIKTQSEFKQTLINQLNKIT